MAAKTIPVSAKANRRQFLVAPMIIRRIHALIYAPTARPTRVDLADLASAAPHIGDF
jgi:hypothetical protein